MNKDQNKINMIIIYDESLTNSLIYTLIIWLLLKYKLNLCAWYFMEW